MIMFNALQVLFKIANILALAILIISYILTVAAKKRKSTLASASIAYPVFSEQHSMIKQCYWSGTLFSVLAWLLCSASVLTVDATIVPTAVISQGFLSYGITWAVAFFIGIVAEIVLKFIKNNSSNSYSVMEGVKSTMWYAVLYFVLSFLIA